MEDHPKGIPPSCSAGKVSPTQLEQSCSYPIWIQLMWKPQPIHSYQCGKLPAPYFGKDSMFTSVTTEMELGLCGSLIARLPTGSIKRVPYPEGRSISWE